jgi:IclR family transcriptional regulator, KDG regulon repressor
MFYTQNDGVLAMSLTKNENCSLVPAVDRAARLLHVIAGSDTPLGVSELSRQLKFNKSTTHDILTTLCHHRLLERDESTKTYRLGVALVELGHRAGEHIDLRAVAHPLVIELARAVEETIILGTYHDGQVAIVDREEAPHDVKITAPLGRRLYYSTGVFGKIFLAAMPEAEANKLVRERPLRAYTAKSITKITAYRAALEQVRAQGYALDDEEYLAGVCAAAAPVNDEQGRVVAALTVVGFSTRLSNARLLQIAKQICETAAEISRQLGAREYPQWNGIG